MVKMGGFRLSSHVLPCNETCYDAWRIKMIKEFLGQSDVLPRVSDQRVIFSQFLCGGGQTLQLPARRAEKMVAQSSSKPSCALISKQERSAPPL